MGWAEDSPHDHFRIVGSLQVFSLARRLSRCDLCPVGVDCVLCGLLALMRLLLCLVSRSLGCRCPVHSKLRLSVFSHNDLLLQNGDNYELPPT